jgi:hypothetical protein
MEKSYHVMKINKRTKMKTKKITAAGLLRSPLFYMLLIMIMLLIPVLGISQPGPGGGGGTGGNPDGTGGSAPIDGGLGLLLAAGVGYGVKKLRDYKRLKKEEENF